MNRSASTDRPNPTALACYRVALRLYPRRLRLRYETEMLQSVRDAYADRSHGALRFWLGLFADLIRSSLQEQLLMAREQLLAKPIFFHTLALSLILTLMGGSAAVAFQQLLRRGANQPQIQMAEDYASRIASGQDPADVLPAGDVDLTRSLEPFAVAYDGDGNPLRANGFIDEGMPTPPAGVFNYLRTHSTDTFTWQPRPTIRIAAVARRIDGPHPAFVLVGRSLRVVEQQEGLLYHAAFIGWFAVVALLIAGAALLNLSRSSAPPSQPN
jgi:hypothetical protein